MTKSEQPTPSNYAGPRCLQPIWPKRARAWTLRERFGLTLCGQPAPRALAQAVRLGIVTISGVPICDEHWSTAERQAREDGRLREVTG